MRFFIFLVILHFLFLAKPTYAQDATSSDTLLIGYTGAAPFIIDEGEELKGISIWLWQKIATSLDLEYKMVGMEFEEMLEALTEGKIDASINPLTITSERSKKMDFTHSYFASNSTIVTRKSTSWQKAKQFAQSFFSPTFLNGLFLLIIIIAIFGVMAWLFERKKNPKQFRTGFMGLWDGLWWSAVTMTTVGYGDKSPKSTGGKIIALVWMFTAILFISGFTASIASSLTVNQLSWNPKSLDDFKELDAGTVQSSGTLEYLNTHLFENIKLYPGINEGLEELKNSKIEAFFYDEPILKYRVSRDPQYSNLEILPIRFDLQFYAFAFSKEQKEVKDKVSKKMLEYLESIDWKYLVSEYNLSQL